MHEPYIYLNGLKLKDLEDLVEDIKVYMELEKGKNFDYWNDITVIVEDELHKMRKIQKQSSYTGKYSIYVLGYKLLYNNDVLICNEKGLYFKAI